MNERQAYLAIRNAIRLENLSEDVAQKVAPALRAVFNELGNQFRRMPPGNLEREIWYRQQRLRIADLLAPLSREMRDHLYETLGKEVAQQMHYAEGYLRIAGEDPANLVAAAAPQDGVSLSPTSGTFAAGRPQFTRTQLHAITQDVKVMGERLEDLFEPVIGQGEVGPWIRQNLNLIDTKVKAGFLTGQTNEQIANQLPGFGAEAIRRNKAIARTAVMDLSAKAQEAFWSANSDVIAGWEFDASMDNRVCERCAPWDGEFNKVRGKLPNVPVHVNCRCRVLPLTATEMLLREEEGTQRRSVVELIEAPTKEKALELAKAKPGVVAVRAYSSQVKVKGKKYWRIAKDIEQKDHPLTMGEFLRQASPQTQLQVLGSRKRVVRFLGLIGGKDGNTPISPDLALKRVVEWQPTVSRKPRLSAEMRLEIGKLRSQKELMRRNSEGEAHIVYGYLRGKDSGTAKAGTPYYIGIGNSHTRAYQPHTRGGKDSRYHNVPVPKDEALVRQFGVFPNRAAAAKREQELIARYGRKGMDDGGILLNRTLGGEGALGRKLNSASREKLSATRKATAELSKNQREAVTAARYGFDLEQWQKLSMQQQKQAKSRFYHTKGAIKGSDLLENVDLGNSEVNPRTVAAAKRYGVSVQEFQSLSQKSRTLVAGRYSRGVRGADLFKGLSASESGIDPRLVQTAKKYEIDISEWIRIGPKGRALVNNRYASGVRGAANLLAEGGGNESRLLETAKRLGVPFDTWKSLSTVEKSRILARHKAGVRGVELLTPPDNGGTLLKATADRLGVPADWWARLTQNQRSRVQNRYATGKRGAALQEGVDNVLNKTAADAIKMGIDVGKWESMPEIEKRRVRARYRRGKRGAALLDGLL